MFIRSGWIVTSNRIPREALDLFLRGEGSQANRSVSADESTIHRASEARGFTLKARYEVTLWEIRSGTRHSMWISSHFRDGPADKTKGDRGHRAPVLAVGSVSRLAQNAGGLFHLSAFYPPNTPPAILFFPHSSPNGILHSGGRSSQYLGYWASLQHSSRDLHRRVLRDSTCTRTPSREFRPQRNTHSSGDSGPPCAPLPAIIR